MKDRDSASPAETDPIVRSPKSFGDIHPSSTPWGRTSRRTPPTETLRIQGWFTRSGRKPLCLFVEAGRTALRRTVLHPEWLMQSALTLGSREGRAAAFQYDEEGVAPLQCRVAFTRGDYHLQVLDDTCVTAINGMTICSDQGSVRIQPGDVLALGPNVRIRFEATT